MEIQTKHKVGDEFWVMHQNRPVKTSVKSISVNITNEKTEITYRGPRIETKYDDSFYPYTNEEFFYPTKELLISAL
jgi:hypothetical protein